MRLKGVDIAFAGADADGLLEGTDEDFAVADLAGAGSRRNRLDRAVDEIACDRHFDFQLRQEAHGIFGAAVDFGVALLAAVAFDLGYRQTVHADGGEGVAHLVQFERLYDRHYYFHVSLPAYAHRSRHGSAQAGGNSSAVPTPRPLAPRD